MNNFEEATKAAEELFAASQNDNQENTNAGNEPANTDVQETVPNQETPQQDNPEANPMQQGIPAQTLATEDAVQAAEAAANLAMQQNAEIERMRQENESFRARNAELEKLISQMNTQQENSIIDEVIAPPELDINGLAFADEDTFKAEMQRYANEMSKYSRSSIMKELAPAIEFAKKGMRESERNDAISALSDCPELGNISELMPQIDNIIANTPAFSSDDVSMQDKIMLAALVAKGINSVNNEQKANQTPSVDELMALYDDNEEFQNAIEKKRIEALKQNRQVPPMSASSGAASAALNIPESPKNLDEASSRAREFFEKFRR